MGCVDHPSDRKKHSGNAALVGGIGILIVVSLGHRLFLPESIPLFHSLMLPLVVIGLIGFIDDMYSLSSKFRLLVQFVTGFFFWLYVGDIRFLGEFMGHSLSLGEFSFWITVIGLVGTINAFNMIDGLDGLCTGQFIVTLIMLVVASLIFRSSPLAPTIFLVIGAAAGFLVWNFGLIPIGKCFLGDFGSTLMGLFVFFLIVEMSQSQNPSIHPIMALWAILFPICEIVGVVVRRALLRRNIFKADRLHLHHLLVDSGTKAIHVVLMLLVFSFVISAVGLLITYQFGPTEGGLVFILTVMLYLIASYSAQKQGVFNER